MEKFEKWNYIELCISISMKMFGIVWLYKTIVQIKVWIEVELIEEKLNLFISP